MRRLHLSLFVVFIVLFCLARPSLQFGAGNIASISSIEGVNWRHGDIEDMLKKVACLKGHKWTSMMIKRVYFGNFLRDYSQAVDVGTLKGVQADTIRILVWILAFMSFGYATKEFEVTHERLGVYRPEEHIDNPRDYADNEDARKYDSRLRGPVSPEELAIDPNTGMKNYIANEHGGWATSVGYVKHSFTRAIHYGRMYTHGTGGSKGREEDLCEALRCLGQGLHTLEDFGAHTNYTELALRELGFHNVFPHTGTATQMNIHGKHVFPLVTGTFGAVDFLHSVLGEATDHFTQSEVDVPSEMDELTSQLNNSGGATGGKRSGNGSSGADADGLISLLSKIPGTSPLCQQAQTLEATSDAQAAQNAARGYGQDNYSGSRAQAPQFAAPPGSVGGPPGPGIPGMDPNFDPQSVVPKIYPILEFRDNVVRSISNAISKIPGLESLVEKISEKVTQFVFSLLAPIVLPLINAASKQLKAGSSTVIDASGKHQYEPWTDPHCTDPTHSLLSKDHFANVLNEPAGQIACAILEYVAPRVIYAMDHPNANVDEVLHDVCRVFHHPALRDNHCEAHRKMFSVVENWARSRPGGGRDLDHILSSESVKAGKNNIGGQGHTHGGQKPPAQQSSGGGAFGGLGNLAANFGGSSSGHGGSSGGGVGGLLGNLNKLSGGKNPLSSILGGSGFGKREADSASPPAQQYQQHTPPAYDQHQPSHHHQQPPPHHQQYGYQQDAPLPPGPPQNNPQDPYAIPSHYQAGWSDQGPSPGPYGHAQPPPPPQGGYPPYGGDQGGAGQWGQQGGGYGGGGYGGQQPPQPPPGGHWGGQY
ncbi:heterokaryon incompatibility protein Het-C-domain-containing protein [Phyllosticta capitalensis]|uniref:heterokaryon incompatibility protein Het-C-domain-containing protein n=1 Tax=Phyllosticta capitalensis TaxID=121624 RepID=UPI00312DC374